MDLDFLKPEITPQDAEFHDELRDARDRGDGSYSIARDNKLTGYYLDGKQLTVGELPTFIPPGLTTEHNTNLPIPSPRSVLIKNPLKWDPSIPARKPRIDPIEARKKADDMLSLYPHDIQESVTELLRCEDKWCEHYEDLYDAVVLELWELKRPNQYAEFEQCVELGKDDKLCQRIYNDGAAGFATELFEDLLKTQRDATPDPLQDYSGSQYSSPFWFELAGNIWRRLDHKSRRISVYNCRKIRADAEQCIVENHDGQGGADICYRLYQNSLICEPGANCPYLRYPLLTCFRTISQPDYDGFRGCVKDIPNYISCRFKPVSQWSVYTEGKHFPDMSEYTIKEGTQVPFYKPYEHNPNPRDVKFIFYPDEDDRPKETYDWLKV